MKTGFDTWLASQGLGANSINSYMTHLRAIEAAYGDLDAVFAEDQFQSLIEALIYSADDERHGRANPSKVNINTHLYKTLASHRTILRRYASFRDAYDADDIDEPSDVGIIQDDTPAALSFELEKDLQQALRNNIQQLEAGLEIIDGGRERKVASGFIDILARDQAGQTVVIELKSIKAPLKAQAQISSYMGDIAMETGVIPRGILIAPDFDPKLVVASSIVPGLSLVQYHYTFNFTPIS